MKCSNCRWRLLKVRCNNGSSAIAATTTIINIIIVMANVATAATQQQQQASLLCGFVMPTKVSFSQGPWLALRRHLYRIRSPFFRSFARRGFFGNLALLHKFQRANGYRPARHPPCVAATAAAWRLLLSLSVVAPKRFAFCLFCVNLKSALVMRLQQQQQEQ